MCWTSAFGVERARSDANPRFAATHRGARPVTLTEEEHLRTTLANRYAISGVVGAGGMATVYRATDIKHQRKVAIKVLRTEVSRSIGTDRFLREIEIAAGLQHPRIVPLYDSGDEDGLLYFVMPLIEGESLRERLSREGTLPPDEALRITREVASALTYAHAHGVVHRDIKPDNIMLSGGETIVADFGIARALDAAGGTRHTTSGFAVGTPSYMSPEQASGDAAIDGRSDIYSLACVLYEMLSGEPPYSGDSAASVLRQHVGAAVPRASKTLTTTSPTIGRVIERALAKAPSDRFSSATQFADALSGSGAHDVVASGSRRMKRGLMLAAALAATAATTFLLKRERTEVVTDASLIAVLPFRVSGDSSVAFLSEGMVDLLTTQLGSVAGTRSLDSRTVLAAWHRAVRDNSYLTTREASTLASSLGSGRVVLGEIVSTSTRIAIDARVLGVNDSLLTTATVRGSPDSLFVLIDRLTTQLLVGITGEPPRRIAELTSTSLSAVRAYLDGRAASRRGEVAKAISHFTDALAQDSTFALAALGMASSGAWSQQSGQSAALRRGLQTGYALRDRLTRRDQLLFEAYVLPNTATQHSAAAQFAGWQRAIDAAPESAEAQYEYGDRLYHTGAQLGFSDTDARARAAFERALSLDSTFVSPLAHLVEMAARERDRGRTRTLSTLYTSDAAAADAGDYVHWRVALALGDAQVLTQLRARRDTIGITALNRIIGFGQTDGIGLADVDAAASELRRRVDARTVQAANVPPGLTLHSWALNRGHRSAASDAAELLRNAEPMAAGSSIVFFDPDQVPALAALFWDGDSVAASGAFMRIAQNVASARPTGSGALARYYTNLCVAGLEQFVRGRPQAVAPIAERLRVGGAARDSAAMHGADPTLCLAMLDAIVANARSAPAAAAAVARRATMLAAAPYAFCRDVGNLVGARLYESRGVPALALRAVRRRPYDWDTGPLYLTTYLREEGRLATRTGDSAGAIRAYERLLALRAGADAVYEPEAAAVRAQLDALQKK